MHFYLISFFFIPFLAFAQPGNLSIVAENGEKFTVFLNEVRQNDKPVSVIRIEGLNSPYYNVRIQFSDSSLKTLSKNNITIIDVNELLMDAVYHLKIEKPGKMKLQLYSMTTVNQAEIAKDALIVRNGLIIESHLEPINKDSAKHIIETIPAKIPGSEVSKELPATKKATPFKKCNGWPMAKEDFVKIKVLIADLKTESGRLKIAKSSVTGNCLLVTQILQLCSLLPSEVARLEFAEYVYQFTVDRQNFIKLKYLFKEPKLRSKIDNIIAQR